MVFAGIVLVVIVLIYGIFFAIANKDIDYFFSAGILAVIIIVATVVVVTLVAVLSSDYNGHPVKKNLQAISTGTETHGSFFLGVGGFGSDAKYYAYIQEDAGFRLYTFDADNVHVIEQQGAPYVIDNCGSDDVATWITWPIENNDNRPLCDMEHDSVTFYVPPGSINSTIDLSLPGGSK